MANSGTITGGNGTYNVHIYVYWETLSQSIANNTSTVRAHLYLDTGSANINATFNGGITVNGEYRSVDKGMQWYDYGHTYELWSGDFTIGHNSDGQKTFGISATMTCGWTTIGTLPTASGDGTLNRIPRQANIKTAPNFNDEENPTVTYENTAGNAVTTLQMALCDTSNNPYVDFVNVNKTGTLSYTFNLDSARATLRNATPNSNTMTVRFRLKTVIGGQTYYSNSDKTLSIVNANPTLAGITYEDSRSETVALTGDSSKIVKGQSTLAITGLTSPTALKGASLTGVIVNDVQEAYSSGYTKSIASYGLDSVVVKLVDSRGNVSSPVQVALTVVNYAPVVIASSAVNRDNGISATTELTANGSFFNGSFGSVTNALTCSYKYKEEGASQWTTGQTTLSPTLSNNSFNIEQNIRGDITAGFTAEKAFVVQLTASDSLTTAVVELRLRSGEPAIKIDGNTVKWLNGLFPIGSVFITTTNTNPSTYLGGTWQQFGAGRTLVGVDTSDTDFDASGKTGGEKSHTLTTDEMPKHAHDIVYGNNNGNGVTISYSGSGKSVLNVESWAWRNNGAGGHGNNIYGALTGGDGSHNNLQPYITVDFWHRTA